MEAERVRSIDIFEYDELVRVAAAGHHGEGCLSRLMQSLGPAGCGLIAVRGVPSLPSSREALLPLARFLALSPPLLRSNILKGHRLGTDVSFKDPDRLVSSFAAQLCFGKDKEYVQVIDSGIDAMLSSHCHEHIGNGLHQLGSLFRELGKEMVDVGLLVAKICDMAIPGIGLEEAILQACTAKGRLIHYHSLDDSLFLQAVSSSVGSRACKQKKTNQLKGVQSSSTLEDFLCKDFWQQWHFDYGILTVLTVPMFLSILDMDMGAGAASDHLPDPEVTYSLPVNEGESDALCRHIGLKVLNTSDRVVEFVNVPPDCLIVQLGEAAQILTGGKLRATAHCVCRPPKRSDISRETFVVFLQPAWHKLLCWPSPATEPTVHSCLEMKHLISGECSTTEKDFEEIQSKVPALESRWKNGSTFAEFSKETTLQYYGANGLQSKK